MIDPRVDPQDGRYDPWSVAIGRFGAGGLIAGMGLLLVVLGIGVEEAFALYIGIGVAALGLAFVVWGYALWRTLPPRPRKEKALAVHAIAAPRPDPETLRAATAVMAQSERRSAAGEACSLCGATQGVARYGVYVEHYDYGPQGISAISWNIDSDGLDSKAYCDECVRAARSMCVRRAAMVFFMPTLGIYRLWKFTTCSSEEMGDLMVASERQGRNPLKKHILWPYGGGTYGPLDTMTREAAQKRLMKQHSR